MPTVFVHAYYFPYSKISNLLRIRDKYDSYKVKLRLILSDPRQKFKIFDIFIIDQKIKKNVLGTRGCLTYETKDECAQNEDCDMCEDGDYCNQVFIESASAKLLISVQLLIITIFLF